MRKALKRFLFFTPNYWLCGPVVIFVFYISFLPEKINVILFGFVTFFFSAVALIINLKVMNGKWSQARWFDFAFYCYVLPGTIWAGYLANISGDLLLVPIIILMCGPLIFLGLTSRKRMVIYWLSFVISDLLSFHIIEQKLILLPYKLYYLLLGLYFYWLGLASNILRNQFAKNKASLETIRKDKLTIQKEREKSENILANILPGEIISEIKTQGISTPKQYNSVTVMFTDFVGFTQIASIMKSEELIKELDNCFSYFDAVTKKYSLEKIKTIGDSYMSCAGIPISNKTHPVDAVLAALEIRSFMAQMKQIKSSQNLPFWELRLGINTGPLVAGVIGEMKFTYDVFGDTVNTASRMESSGVAGEINISEFTHELIKDFFICENRGKLIAKNKGMMSMYFVKSLRPELSVAGETNLPNETFQKLYSRLKASAD